MNDLLSFNINLLDDNNKQITFAENEKKISILNFKIDVFLRRTEDSDQLNLPNTLKRTNFEEYKKE